MKKTTTILACISAGVFLASCQLPSIKDKERFYAFQTATAIFEEAQNEIMDEEILISNDQQHYEESDIEESEQLIVNSGGSAEAIPEPTATPDPNRKAPELPATFSTDLLNPIDTPHTYVEDTCKFLKNRWSSGKAEPGTIVMAIMYHSIVKGDSVNQDNAITVETHKWLMDDLHNQGFTAIDMEQFIGFITENDYIPERSVLLIVDDRHSEENYQTHFLPYYQQWGWKVINAWISAEGTTQELWDGNARAEAEGYVDHQAHGVVHNQNMDNSCTDEFLIGELKGSVDAIEEHFGKTPQAIIWPGGGFGSRPVEIAKQYGYKVGFTTNPRGPIMYNWVPLCDKADENRPYFLQDGNVVDPLFVLPRYWDTDASQHVDTVRQIGKAAKEYIYANRETELEYYDIVCKPITGELE